MPSIPESIPKEIVISTNVSRNTKSEKGHVMTAINKGVECVSSTNCMESNFTSGIISTSSDEMSYQYNIDTPLPLNYRLDWTSDEKDNLKRCISQNDSPFMENVVSMEEDTFCLKPNEWEIESVCGDSLDTEEDMISIRQWINNENEDFWECL